MCWPSEMEPGRAGLAAQREMHVGSRARVGQLAPCFSVCGFCLQPTTFLFGCVNVHTVQGKGRWEFCDLTPARRIGALGGKLGGGLHAVTQCLLCV